LIDCKIKGIFVGGNGIWVIEEEVEGLRADVGVLHQHL